MYLCEFCEGRLLSTGTKLDLVEPIECPTFQKDWSKQMSNLTTVVSQLFGKEGFERFVTPERLRLSGHPVDASILGTHVHHLDLSISHSFSLLITLALVFPHCIALPQSGDTTRHAVKPMIVQDALDTPLCIEEALERLPGAVAAVTFDIHYKRGTNGVHEFNNCITQIMVIKGVDEKDG